MGKDLNKNELGKGYCQRKTGIYQYKYIDCFGKPQFLYDRDFNELRKKVALSVADSLHGKSLKSTTVTLDEWFKTWLDIEKHGVIGDTTRVSYIRVYNKHISPELGSKKLKDFDKLTIQRFLVKLEKNGSGFATRWRILILFTDMFDKAVVHHYMNENVASRIKLVRDEEVERRYLSHDEIDVFLKTAYGSTYYNLFMVALQSGLRGGELYALTEDDLDFEKGVIKVTKTLHYDTREGQESEGKQFFFGPPKTKSSVRSVPMTDLCKEALLSQLQQKKIIASKQPKSKIVADEFTSLIFTTRFNTPLNSQNTKDAINNELEKINLLRHPLEKMEDFSMHSLRHTFGTLCLESGVEFKTLQKWMGHASVQMTQDLYTHISDDFAEEQLNDVNVRMNKVFNTDNEVSPSKVVLLSDFMSSKRCIEGVTGF